MGFDSAFKALNHLQTYLCAFTYGSRLFFFTKNSHICCQRMWLLSVRSVHPEDDCVAVETCRFLMRILNCYQVLYTAVLFIECAISKSNVRPLPTTLRSVLTLFSSMLYHLPSGSFPNSSVNTLYTVLLCSSDLGLYIHHSITAETSALQKWRAVRCNWERIRK